MRENQPIVFVVEDDPNDLDLLKIACEERRCDMAFQSVVDGAMAIERLRRILDHPEREVVPDLILLDLNLPRVHGIEVLSFIARHPRLREIPVVVLSTSDAPQDREQCARLGAEDYLVKPARFEEMCELVQHLEQRLNGSTANGGDGELLS